MSAFGNYEQDAIVYAIEELARFEFDAGKSPREIVELIMKAVTYGIDNALYEMRNHKVHEEAIK